MGVLARAYSAVGAALGLVDARTSPTVGDVPKVQQTGGAVNFGGSATGTVFDQAVAGAISSAISCDGYESIVLKPEYKLAAGGAAVRVWLKDANATPGWTPLAVSSTSVDLKNTGITRSGSNVGAVLKATYFQGEVYVVPTHGAKQFAVEIATLNGAGNKLSMWGVAR